MMPKMPKITNTIEIPSKTPHKLRLNFRLCSRFKLFWADHKEYELVVWWPLRWLPSGGYFLEDVEWTDLFDLMEDAVVNACLGTVPPGWGTLAPPCAKLRREANDMASSLSLSSKASFLWKKNLKFEIKIWIKHCDQFLFLQPILSARVLKSFF